MINSRINSLAQTEGIIFLAYGGFLNQSLISGMTEALELEHAIESSSIFGFENVLTVFIEMSQNMMNYAKYKSVAYLSCAPDSTICVAKTKDGSLYIASQNIIDNLSRDSVIEKLDKLIPLSKEEIKKEYKIKRREKHDKSHIGAGIGFYEIAKRCQSIEYEIEKIDEEKSFFRLQANM